MTASRSTRAASPTCDTCGASDGSHRASRLTPPGDAQALAVAVATLRHDADMRAALAAAGHRLFQEQFSIDALAGELGALFRTIVRAH